VSLRHDILPALMGFLAHRWKLLAGLLVLTLAGYFALPAFLGPKVTPERVIRSDVVRTVVASGRVQTPFRVEIGSQITGTVAAIPVTEGQFVHRDQLLIRLDDREALAGVEQAEAAVAQAEAQVKQIADVSLPVAEEAHRQAVATRISSEQQFERIDQLKERGAASQAQWDEARRSLDVARSQERSALLQVNRSKPGGNDYRLAEAALRLAKANLALARSRLSYTMIQSPADGTLIARKVERGDVVQPGRALMVLSPAGDIEIIVQIDEKNLSMLKLGQKALVSADAYPDDRFDAELVFINPSVDPQRASVEAKLRVLSPPDYIRQDMTVSVDIETARKTGAFIVPNGVIRDASGAKPWVLKIREGRAVRQEVRLGFRSDGKTEIVEGLQEGDLVLPGSLDVSEGRRVRAVRP